jgi:hypothetical protein
LSKEDSRIADLHLCFNNACIHNLLSKRAEMLKQAKYDEAEAIEKELTMLKDKKF